MKNLYLIASIMSALFLIWSCKYAPTEPTKNEVRPLTQTEAQLVSSADKFGLNLFKKVNELEQNQNLFISPLSVSLALGMTLNGANTSTYESMRNTLELPDISQAKINEAYKSLIEFLTGIDPKVNFKIANSIFYRNTYTFEPDFIEVNKKYFDALVRGLNFNDPATVNIINQWVKENTNGKIDKIVDSIEEDIVMFLINALYFKGIWKYEFDKKNTRDDLFIGQNGTQSPCQMMVQVAEFNYLDNEDFQAIDLPYGDGAFSMTIFLPKQNSDVNSFITNISEGNWNNWLSSFTNQKVNLYLPKFKLEYEIEMKNVLTALGMGEAFDPHNADFTKLYSGPGRTYISKVKHKTFVDVYEEGTEAAAVTSVEIGIVTDGVDIIMRCDRPFVFVIREKNSNSILFIGKITKP